MVLFLYLNHPNVIVLILGSQNLVMVEVDASTWEDLKTEKQKSLGILI